MRRSAVSVGAALLLGLSGCAAPSSWTGIVSDDYCGAYHVWDEHGPPLTERECTLISVERGAKFVLVVDDVVHPIENQDHPDLAQAAGHKVTVRGRMIDGVITMTAIDVLPAR